MAKRQRPKREPSRQPPQATGPLARATLCVETARADDLRAARAWLQTHRSQLSYVSPDEGCGCCVHLWRVEGPPAVIATLPEEISAADGGQWNRST